MNYLFHLFLSDPDQNVMLGNLMGDFVKGRLDLADFPETILFGLRQHRQIDSFANQSSGYQASRHRIDPEFGYFRSIMVDVFYDHFLARHWERHHPLPLDQFAEQVYQTLENNFELLPPDLQQIVPRMIKHNWLVSYREIETIETVLLRLDQRIKRPSPLSRGGEQLKQHYDMFDADFDLFLIQAQDFLSNKRWCQTASNNRK